MNINSQFTNPWICIQAQVRKETVAAAHLQFRGYEVYLPVYKKQKSWSDRIVTVECPLFPGYLFCRYDSVKPPIVTTPGVVSVLGPAGRPETVPEGEIAAIQTMLRSGLAVLPHPYLQEGETITITGGPLKGIQGIFVKNKSEMRVVVSVKLLQRSVAVDVDRQSVKQEFGFSSRGPVMLDDHFAAARIVP
jgi:transcription antitermination factor NusG